MRIRFKLGTFQAGTRPPQGAGGHQAGTRPAQGAGGHQAGTRPARVRKRGNAKIVLYQAGPWGRAGGRPPVLHCRPFIRAAYPGGYLAGPGFPSAARHFYKVYRAARLQYFGGIAKKDRPILATFEPGNIAHYTIFY